MDYEKGPTGLTHPREIPSWYQKVKFSSKLVLLVDIVQQKIREDGTKVITSFITTDTDAIEVWML